MMQCTESSQRARARESNPKRRIFDWISKPRPQNVTPFQQFILDVDWEKSPLGPMKHWPAQLKQMVLLVVQDPSPAVVYWGDDATIVYNEAYTHLIGSKHPALQGQDPKIEFAEIWGHFEALLANQRETASTVVEANAFLLLKRHGFLEETYFSWKFVPIIGEDGWVVGSHATVVEVTREVISDRRLQVVRNLSKQLSGSKSIKNLWTRIIRGIEGADKDIPLALLYSVADSTTATASRASSRGSNSTSSSGKSPTPPRASRNVPATLCILEGSLGIPEGHALAPETIDLETEKMTCIVDAVQRALRKMTTVVVPIEEEDRDALNGIEWRGYGVPPTQIVACPIIPMDSGSDSVLGFLVMALNPRRPYDDDYRGFLHLLTQQVTQPQLSAVILREEVERRQLLARQEALDRARLSRELSESETKFARFASRAPIGLAILAPDGTALSANPLWRELTCLEVGTSSPDWGRVLVEGELELVMAAWERLLMERRPITMQTRMKRPWRAPDLDHDGKVQYSETHILLAMYPDQDEQGEVFSVMSCITDVSGMKWSEIQLRRRMDQAIEMKRQQERFIDMTSHEMRNPLSALIGCADEIIASLTEYRSLMLRSGTSTPGTNNTNTNSVFSSPSRSNSWQNIAGTPLPHAFPSTSSLTNHTPHTFHPRARHLIDEAIEAADTIIYCAMHQKRIIDDILTLSRLDSNLLLVSPEPCQPIPLIRSALKMFEAELKRAATTLTFIEDPSLVSLAISWTLLDPSRVLQVLINLMTNAIKFTRTETRREITVKMCASLTRPSEQHRDGDEDENGGLQDERITYVERSRSSTSSDQTTKAEWGDGEIIYLSITVTDTGRGLSDVETRNLFRLFAQASPKTHQTYGGSGLGLFISRQLVNMQGGEIGVRSRAGEGSTFTFYVKTRRTAPEPELETAGGERAGEAGGAGKKNFDVLVREDALREACAVEISPLLNGSTLLNPEPEDAPTPAVAAVGSGTIVAEKKTTKKFHILVVEDNLVNQKVVTKSLRKSGHTVSVANHGEEALDFIMRSEFWWSESEREDGMVDGEGERGGVLGGEIGFGHIRGEEEWGGGEKLNVVLMDLEMPVMDGLTCVRRIREWQAEGKLTRHAPVIAVTANARKDQIMNSLDAGMDDVTTKPYRMTDMLKQIEKLVAKHTPHGV